MYRMIIVDDEPLILQHLTEVFPWHELGFEVCGSFTNSEQAYDYLQNKKVDVLFTDIRLNGDTGLSLARRVKHICPHIQIVLISAYSEFEYAREAISLSIFEYLLKPISYNSVINCFQRLRTSLDSHTNSSDDIVSQLARHLKNGDSSTAGHCLDLYAQYNPLSKEQLLRIQHRLFITLDEQGIISENLPTQDMAATLRATTHPQDTLYELHKQLYLLSSALTKPDFNAWYVSEAKRYIEDHLSEDISLNDVAAHVSLSPAYFSRTFRRLTGERMSDYICRCRIKKAIELLKDPAVRIGELNTLVGYHSRSGFYTLFLKETGYTPAEYRKEVLHLH
ncbi:MAG: response regulator [Ruminococcaceae bacterium]|nr:response regulator [Oscillospiraceae bacterium]